MRDPRFTAHETVMRSTLDPASKAVYTFLDVLARGKDEVTGLSQAAIAQQMNMPLRTFCRCLAKLRAHGAVEIRHGKTVSRYLFGFAITDLPQRMPPMAESGKLTLPNRHTDSATLAESGGASNKVLNNGNNDVRTPFHEDARTALRDYPPASALPGVPDDQIVRQSLDAAGGSWDNFCAALQAMNRARATPSRSWAWFPVVIARTLRSVSFGAKAS